MPNIQPTGKNANDCGRHWKKICTFTASLELAAKRETAKRETKRQ